jgi:caa(3)-type oxidase subunit IV
MEEGRDLAPIGPEKGLEQNAEALPPEGRFGPYIAVWVGIILLTGLSFATSRMSAEGGHVIACLFIAGIQSGLALTYFMHLGSEKQRIFKVLIPLVLAVLLVFMGLTFSDVAFRR